MASQPKPLSPKDAYELIQKLLERPDCLSLTNHFRKQSYERHVDVFDLRMALQTGCVKADSWDEKYQNWKYRVDGRDVDGDSLTLIVVLHEAGGIIKVVTAYD